MGSEIDVKFPVRKDGVPTCLRCGATWEEHASGDHGFVTPGCQTAGCGKDGALYRKDQSFCVEHALVHLLTGWTVTCYRCGGGFVMHDAIGADHVDGCFGPKTLPSVEKPAAKHDHPAHYGGKDAVYETIKVIAAWFPEGVVFFCLGNAIKYISRAGKKGGESVLDDLKKARWYLDWTIEWLESKES